MPDKSSENLKQPLIEAENLAPTQNAKVGPIMSLFKHADAKDRLHIIVGTICALGTGCSFPFFMIFFGDILQVFYELNRWHSEELAFEVTLKFFIIGGVTWFLSFLGLYCWNISGSNQALRFKKMYYKTLLEQEVAWYDTNDVNKLATEVATNIAHIEGAIGQKCFMLIATVTTSLFGFFYAYIKCWQLSLVLTGILPFMMIAGVLMMKSLGNMSLASKASYEDAAGRAEQAFGGIKTIKSLVGEAFEERLFLKSLNKGSQKTKSLMLVSAVSLSFVMFIFLGVYSLGFWFAKWLVIHRGYEAGVVVGTFFCFIIGGSSIGQISPVLKNVAEGRVAVQILYDLMERKKTLNEKVKDGKKIKNLESIEFSGVNFGYRKVNLEGDGLDPKANQEENIVLQNINLKILPNKVNALVGESGSGKSTISQLLMRYYDPLSGQILVNETPLTQININNLRRKIGYVGQEPVLFAMSIQENIKLANPEMTESQIIEVLKKANAWEFVQKLEKGIKTYVGNSGAQISGGQKQRIAIARAIAKNPQILILDEATSALDRKNEREIQKTLKNLVRENITTLVIAHRLSTIKDADKITVLSKGKIVEQGTHTQLTNLQGLYYTLVKSQLSDGGHEGQYAQMETKSSEVVQGVEKTQEVKNVQDKKIEIPKQKLDAVFGKLFKLVSKHNCLLYIGVLAALVNGSVWPFFNIAFSNILALMQDAANHDDEINDYCLLFLATAIAGAICTFAYKFPFDVYGQKVVYEARKNVFGKLMRFPVSFYDKKENTPGGVATKLASDAYQLNNMISGVCAVMCMNFSTVTISLIFAFTNSWMLTLIVLGLSPLIVVAGAVNMAVIKKLTSKTEQTQKFIGSLISDTVINIRTVKSFGNNQLFLDKYGEKLDTLSKLNSEKALKSSFFDGMGRGMIMIVEGLTFWFAGMLFQHGHIDEGKNVYIAIFSIIFAAMGVGQNSAFMPDMAKAKVAGASIFDIIESKTESELSKGNGKGTEVCTPESVQGVIEFKNVTFKYPERDAIVLENFSYRIQKNSKVAFVGPSGSGKSTITQILQRFYPLESGSIQINGKNIEDFELHSYRQQIGYVSQEPTLFVGTVKDNINYDHEYSQEEIEKMATVAHAKKFIDEWEEKYEKDVGNKGSQVSGGQKQRIALTRCLIRQPVLYVFDESTSALDMDTEKIVFENMKPILKNKTSISIAHRLATIEDSDKIIVMREGRIIEDGTYQELMEKREHFYRLAKGN